jgi:hypothetical protein
MLSCAGCKEALAGLPSLLGFFTLSLGALYLKYVGVEGTIGSMLSGSGG